MKSHFSALIILFVFLSCSQEISKTKQPTLTEKPYWSDLWSERILGGTRIGLSEKFELLDSVSNRVIIELYTGNHPLENGPGTQAPGTIITYNYRPYSFVVLQFNWEKCSENGWRFTSCEVVEKKGELLKLDEVEMINYRKCESGNAGIRFTVVNPAILEDVRELLDRYSVIVDKIPQVEDEENSRIISLPFRVDYQFSSSANYNQSFFYNSEETFGKTWGVPSGFYFFERLAVACHNTTVGGETVKSILKNTDQKLKIAIWDHFVQ